uniref:Uncharacterized protein n=1 Tax=Arundo donax TaxID=35708 RepID=A0A0A9BUR9_ARUDO
MHKLLHLWLFNMCLAHPTKLSFWSDVFPQVVCLAL